MKVLERLGAAPGLADEDRMAVESMSALARDRIAPRATELDRTAAFPWENVHELNALGANAMFVPEAYGGAPVSYAAYLSCVLAVSRACAATGIVWATNFHAVKPLIDFGEEEQKRRLLPGIAAGGLAALCITEPDAGSDARAMRTRFTPDGDDVVIDGGKTFITNGDVADVYLVFGRWSEIEDPKTGISAVLIEKGTPGLEVLGTEDKMGIRASSTARLALEDVRVPRANVLGRPGDGLTILLAALNKSRPSVAAHALGIAYAAFDEAVAYANQRRQSGRTIAEFQGIQFMLADHATDLAMTLRWLWHVGALIDDGESDVAVEASMLKMKASDLAMAVATDAVQVHGGYGYVKDYPVERLMRDAKICQIWEGTNQIHRQLIGRSLIMR